MRADRRATPGTAQGTNGGSSWGGKTVLLAGATGGVGHAIATKLSEYGATVIVLSRSPEQSAQVDGISRAGRLRHLSMDPSKPADVWCVMAQIMDLGDVDVLINFAAPLGSRECQVDAGPNVLERVFQLNVVVPVDLSTALLPGMIERRWGRVVNVVSGAISGQDIAANEAYVASKEALEAYTRDLAGRLSKTGVTANLVHLSVGSPSMRPVGRHDRSEESAENTSPLRTPVPRAYDNPAEEAQAVSLMGLLLGEQTA